VFINFGGIQQPAGHLTGTGLIVPRADGLPDVGQADEAQLTDSGLHASRHVRGPIDIQGAYPIGWTPSCCRVGGWLTCQCPSMASRITAPMTITA
jgi:hypothetical protein